FFFAGFVWRLLGFRSRPLPLLPANHVGGTPQFLLRDEAGAVDLHRALKFRQRLRKGPCIAQALACMSVVRGGREPHPRIGSTILWVAAHKRVSLLVERVSAIVVFLALRADPVLVRVICLIRADRCA